MFLSVHVGDMNFNTLLKLDIVSNCHCLAMQWDLLCIICPGREGGGERGREREGGGGGREREREK